MGFAFLLAMICATIAPAPLRSLAERARRMVPAGFLWSCGYVGVLETLLLLQLLLLEERQTGAYVPLPRFSPSDLAQFFGIDSVLQSGALALLYVSLASRPERRRDLALVIGGTAVMLAGALCFLNTGGDILAYVGSALLAHPYAPERVRFSGEFAVINGLWRYPLLPSPYGPVWTTLTHFIVVPFHTLRGAMLALQFVEAAAFLGTIALLRGRGVPPATVAVLALNPFIVETYVAEGHNDLIASALVFAGCFVSAPAAVAAVIAAGGMKFPLAVLGLCAFARFESARTRWICAGAVMAGSVVLVLLAGPNYLPAIRTVAEAYWQPLPPVVQALHVACAMLAVAFVIAGLSGKRLPAGGAWCGIALAQYPLYNYLVWGMPFASASGALAVFLITLPYAGFEISNAFVTTPLLNVLRAGVAIAIGFAVYLTARRAVNGLRERPATS
jgi:hypothetical protein